jgi:FAD dependent oxidoreductase TIGR03364
MDGDLLSSRWIDADVCVVGAGIVGLAHAHEARRRGLRVALLEREQRAVGASVRNFGHVFTAGLADGEDLACGLRARERWLELGRRAGLTLVQGGTLVVARAPDELAVLEGACANPLRGARVLTAAQAGELAPIPTGDLVGAMHAALDLRVDPRAAVAGLAGLLEADPGAEVHWGIAVHDIEPGVVHGDGVSVRAPMIVVCPGPDYRTLPPALRPQLSALTLCQLQMLRLAAPAGRRYAPALATGLSLIRYPAFVAQAAAGPLRERLVAERPELVDAGIHLLVTQLPGGDLIVGDTHTYGGTLAPFGVERLNELLLAEAGRLLGADRLQVRERWHGIYPALTGAGHFLTTAPLVGVRVVEVVSGLGMTVSFGQAAVTLDALAGASTLAV